VSPPGSSPPTHGTGAAWGTPRTCRRSAGQ
jgi:hypothetical protein